MAAGSAKPVTLSDATTNTLRVEMTAASNGAEYRCFITDANGDMGSTRVATIKLDILEWEMEYNTSGIRTKRISEEKTYNYIYAGDKLMRMTVGNDSLDFSYDTNGVPLTMTYNGTVYYYITNLQGDVISLELADGGSGAQYAYDAWGNIIAMSGTLAELNPLRYRGYVYDQETGFYYLNSRYYDPAVGRFISADKYASTGQGITGYNMFAYCGNNPVCATDKSGAFSLRDLWNAAEDAIWKLGAKVLKGMGYDLTGSLLAMSASGPNNVYRASTDSAAAKQIASEKGFVNSVRDTYKNEYTGGTCFQSKTHSYAFPVAQGDLGAALHNVDYSYKTFYDKTTGKQALHVTVTDTFDFTEFKNPFTQGSVKAGFLWLANDIAYIDTKWGLLDPVYVEINIVIPIDP